MLRDRQYVAVAACVHGAFLQRIANCVRLRCARAAQCIVAAHRIGNNLCHDVAARRQQLAAATQVHIALFSNGIDSAVAVRDICRIEEQGIRGLITLHVHDSQSLVSLDSVDPIVARWNHAPIHGLIGVKMTALAHVLTFPAATAVQLSVGEATAVFRPEITAEVIAGHRLCLA